MLPAVSWVLDQLCPSGTATELVVVVVVGGSSSDVVPVMVVIACCWVFFCIFLADVTTRAAVACPCTVQPVRVIVDYVYIYTQTPIDASSHTTTKVGLPQLPSQSLTLSNLKKN